MQWQSTCTRTPQSLVAEASVFKHTCHWQTGEPPPDTRAARLVKPTQVRLVQQNVWTARFSGRACATTAIRVWHTHEFVVWVTHLQRQEEVDDLGLLGEHFAVYWKELDAFVQPPGGFAPHLFGRHPAAAVLTLQYLVT